MRLPPDSLNHWEHHRQDPALWRHGPYVVSADSADPPAYFATHHAKQRPRICTALGFHESPESAVAACQRHARSAAA